MDRIAPVRVTVQIDSADPLRGKIEEAGQQVSSFTGWTAFATAMNEVVVRAGERFGGGAESV